MIPITVATANELMVNRATNRRPDETPVTHMFSPNDSEGQGFESVSAPRLAEVRAAFAVCGEAGSGSAILADGVWRVRGSSPLSSIETH
jgi:hypothetical protein